MSFHDVLYLHGIFLFMMLFVFTRCSSLSTWSARSYDFFFTRCVMSSIMFHVFSRCTVVFWVFLHTWCVVLKHFPCLYMGFCLHVFRGRGGGNICSNETLCCTALLYGILMSSLTVSVLSNWVSIVTCTPAFVVVHLHWLLHVYRIELN